VEDVNADGDLELIVQLSDSSIHCYSALSATLLWTRQLTHSQPTATFDLRLVDIDNDLYVVVATDDGSASNITKAYDTRPTHVGQHVLANFSWRVT